MFSEHEDCPMSGWKRWRAWFFLGLTGAVLVNGHLVQARIHSIPPVGVVGPNQQEADGHAHQWAGASTSPSSNNELSAALVYLEKGDHDSACLCLSGYVKTHPSHLRARTLLADLLVERGWFAEARQEYASCIGLLQEKGQSPSEQIFCHQRITDIADLYGDDYAAHLHRGIALYLRARHTPGRDGASQEALLCRAAEELAQARSLVPGTSRPCFYLHLVWSRLGQKQLADSNLMDARGNAPFDALTTVEQQELMLACSLQSWR
jgi:hypothetical protein